MSNIKQTIDENIYQNGKGLIRGDIMNNVLKAMVDDYANKEETTSKLTELEREVDELIGIDEKIINVSDYESINGSYINTAGNVVAQSGAKYILIPIASYQGINIAITGNSTNSSSVAFLKNVPSVGNPADFVTGQTHPYVFKDATKEYIIPEDALYLYVAITISNTDRTPLRMFVAGRQGIIEQKEDLANKVNSLDETSTTEQYPTAKCVYKRFTSIEDSIKLGWKDNEPITLTTQSYLYISDDGVINVSSYNARKIGYAVIDKDTYLHINEILGHQTDTTRKRGVIGYVDNVSDIVAGTNVQGIINDATGEEITREYYTQIPLGKVLVISFNSVDSIFVNLTKKESLLSEKNINIINGSYSWWTSPHADRKNIGRRDFSVIAYVNTERWLCVALYNNNTKTYEEKRLMISSQVDDHNGPACAFLPDGRIIVSCAKGHASAPNQYVFVSKTPFSLDSMEEKVVETIGNCTYSRMIIHGEYIFLFWREAKEYDGVSDSRWNFVYSQDNFETWSNEMPFIAQSYVYLEKTTNPDYIKIYPCGHPTENSIDMNKIRAGYIKLSTFEVFNRDGVTKVADLGQVFLQNTDFEVIIDSSTTSKNRMLDAAITDVGVDRFVFAKGNPSSEPYDGKYYYYNNGRTIEISTTGEPFYISSKYVGGIVICRENNDCLIVAREDGGMWKLEKIYISNGFVIGRTLIDFSSAYIIRPVETEGCQFIYQKGSYDPSSFARFETNLIVKDIPY